MQVFLVLLQPLLPGDFLNCRAFKQRLGTGGNFKNQKRYGYRIINLAAWEGIYGILMFADSSALHFFFKYFI